MILVLGLAGLIFGIVMGNNPKLPWTQGGWVTVVYVPLILGILLLLLFVAWEWRITKQRSMAQKSLLLDQDNWNLQHKLRTNRWREWEAENIRRPWWNLMTCIGSPPKPRPQDLPSPRATEKMMLIVVAPISSASYDPKYIASHVTNFARLFAETMFDVYMPLLFRVQEHGIVLTSAIICVTSIIGAAACGVTASWCYTWVFNPEKPRWISKEPWSREKQMKYLNGCGLGYAVLMALSTAPQLFLFAQAPFWHLMVGFCLMKISINAGELILILILYELFETKIEGDKAYGVTTGLRVFSSTLALSIGGQAYQKYTGAGLKQHPDDPVISSLKYSLDQWLDLDSGLREQLKPMFYSAFKVMYLVEFAFALVEVVVAVWMWITGRSYIKKRVAELRRQAGQASEMRQVHGQQRSTNGGGI